MLGKIEQNVNLIFITEFSQISCVIITTEEVDLYNMQPIKNKPTQKQTFTTKIRNT